MEILCTTTHKNLQTALKDSDSGTDYSEAENEQGSDDKGSNPIEDHPPLETAMDDREFIHNLEL